MFRSQSRLIVSDWIGLVFASGYENQPGFTCRVQRRNNRAYLDGIFRRTGGTAFVAASNYGIVLAGGLPRDMRPVGSPFYSGVLAGATAGNQGTVVVALDGSIEYRHITGGATYMSFGDLSWPLD